MYIDTVPNRSSPPAILIRESYRVGGKVKKRTIANISKCPPEVIEALRVLLKGGSVSSVPLEELFEVSRSLPSPRPRRRRVGHHAPDRPAQHDRTQMPRARPGSGPGCRTHCRALFQACPVPPPRPGHRHIHPGPGTRSWCR